MIPQTVLITLATIGLSSEQAETVVGMLQAVEKATAQDCGAAIEARRQADRVRKSRQRSRDNTPPVTGQDVISEVVTPRLRAFSIGEEEELPPSSLRSSAPKGADDGKRGHRLTEAWTPNAGHWALALSLGLSKQQFDDIATEFKNYWLSESGQRARKLDWDRTFTNRITDRAKHILKGMITNGKRTVHDAARDLSERAKNLFGDAPQLLLG